MIKVVLMSLLAVASSNATAEWISLGNDSDVTLYVEPTTVRHSGDTVKIWSLLDYKKLTTDKDTNKAYLSRKDYFEFNCGEAEYRTTASHGFYGNMGRGDVVYSFLIKSPKWLPVVPDSKLAAVAQFACGRAQAQQF